MTLEELRRRYRSFFLPNQTWFTGEAFMQRHGVASAPPSRLLHRGEVPPKLASGLPWAADLAQSFVATCDHPIWSHWFWCADTDRFGQRVFVGGVRVENGYRFEIHRHLHITEQFGVASWEAVA